MARTYEVAVSIPVSDYCSTKVEEILYFQTSKVVARVQLFHLKMVTSWLWIETRAFN